MPVVAVGDANGVPLRRGFQAHEAVAAAVKSVQHRVVDQVGNNLLDGSGVTVRDGPGPFETLFRALVIFSQTVSLFTFLRKDADYPLPCACAELAQLNANLANRYMALLDKDDVVITVRLQIIELLPSGDCSREKVARVMCMSSSTLQLKLAQRNRKF
jgi:hypothetical protein